MGTAMFYALAKNHNIMQGKTETMRKHIICSPTFKVLIFGILKNSDYII